MNTDFCQHYSSFYFCKSDGHKEISYCCFDLYFHIFNKFEHLFICRAMVYRCLLGTHKRMPSQECEWEQRSSPCSACPGMWLQLSRGRAEFANSHWASTSLDCMLISHLSFKFWEFLAHILSLHLCWGPVFSCWFCHSLHIITPLGFDKLHIFSLILSAVCQICP